MLNLKDQKVREQAVQDFKNNLVILAGAGTGKTSLLVERLINACVGENIPLTAIVAITYTEKAAAEMLERVAGALEDMRLHFSNKSSPKTGEALRCLNYLSKRLDHKSIETRVLEALEHLDDTRITTIHGYCAELLRRYPRECGLDPRFQIDEGSIRNFMAESLWPTWLMDELSIGSVHESAWIEILESFDIELMRELALLLVKKNVNLDKVLEAEEFAVELLKESCQTMAGHIDRILENMQNENKNMRVYLENIRQCLGIIHKQGFVWEIIREFDIGKEPTTAGKNISAVSCDDVMKTAKAGGKLLKKLALVDFGCLEKLIHLLRPWRAHFWKNYDEGGYCSFDGLLQKAQELLLTHHELRKLEKKNIRCLLLDEFQDTTPLQYEIIFLLTEKEDQCGMLPYDVMVHPGKLFVVGDLKQSIYRFNGANLNVCRFVIERLEKMGAKVMQLTANFRSVPEILHPLNLLFENAFQSVDRGQASFSALDAARDRTNKGPAVSIWTVEGMEKDTGVDTLREVEAELIADWINREMIRTPLRDMTILLRVMTDVPIYLEALRKRGIPFVVEGGKSFVGKPEVREFIALLRVLANPCDEVALLTLLRSALGSVSDTELASFASGKGVWNPMKPADPDKFPNIARFYTTLAGMVRQSRLMRTDEIIQMALKEVHAVELNGIAYEGSQRVANLSKIADRASSMALRESYNLRETAAFIEQEFNDTDFKEGESPLADEKLDAVRILTVHKAKGLEFPVVIIPDLIRAISRDQQNNRVTLSWNHLHKGIYGLNLRLKDHLLSLTHILLEFEEEDASKFEHMRLFYVAATRAKERLILLVSADHNTPWIQALSAWGYPNALIESEVVNHIVHRPEPFVADAVSSDDWSALIASVKDFQDFRALASSNRGRAWLQSPSHLTQGEVEDEDHQNNKSPKEYPVSLNSHLQNRSASIFQEAGTLMHWFLQTWDFKDPAWFRDSVEKVLKERCWKYSGEEASLLRAQLNDILDSFLRSDLPERLRGLDIVGREMPFMISQKGVLMTGRIDLVYRLEEDFVVADFKSDRIKSGENNMWINQYGAQLNVYACALQNSLRLEKMPRREIWLLRAGEILSF